VTLLLLATACTDAQGPEPGTCRSSAGLSSLALGSATLEPPFDPAIRHYLVRARELGTRTAVTATTARGDDAFLRHETLDGESLTRGWSGLEVPLSEAQRLVIQTCDDDALGEQTTVVPVPDDWPDLTASQTDDPGERYFFLGVTDFADRACDHALAAMIVDPRGTPVWYRLGPRAVYDLRVTDAGELSYVAVSDETLTLQGHVIDPVDHRSLRTLSALPSELAQTPSLDSHELHVLADGGALSLATTTHLEDLTVWGAGAETLVVDALVQERDADDALVFQWSPRGHVDHSDLPLAHLNAIADGWDYAHLNSVDVDPADGHWVVSLRLPSQVMKIARTDTSWAGQDRAAGDVLWTLGGATSDLAFVGDDRDHGWQGFAGQHSARVLPDDQLAVFDNASHLDLGATGDARLAVYALDHGSGTATLIHQFPLDGAGSVAVAGSVQRLDDGWTAVGWGPAADATGTPLASVTLLDEDLQQVLDLTLPRDCWSYRAWSFQGDPVRGQWTP